MRGLLYGAVSVGVVVADCDCGKRHARAVRAKCWLFTTILRFSSKSQKHVQQEINLHVGKSDNMYIVNTLHRLSMTVSDSYNLSGAATCKGSRPRSMLGTRSIV